MPFWLPNGTTLLRPDRGRGPGPAAQARLPGDRHAAGARRGALAPLRALGQLPRRHVLHASPTSAGYALRPMNCPGACLVFGSERHSYRELPLRLAEFGRVSRNEREGVLHGLLRVRAFTQDDAHVYCTEEQIADEVTAICEAIDELYARFGFEDVRVELSTRPEKSMGTEEQWDEGRGGADARRSSARAASTSSTPATAPSTGRRSTSTSPTRSAAPGSAAPASSTSRCPSASTSPTPAPTTQQHRPVMIHRALLGSMERFAGILIEHYAGRFPVWLAPVQAIVLPVADRHIEYAARVAAELREAGVRVERRRALGVGRQEDPRRRARPLPLHAGRRRPRAGGRRRRRPLPRGGRARGDAARRVRRPGRGRERAPELDPAATAPCLYTAPHLIAGTPNTPRR